MADHAAADERTIRLVTLTDASTTGGRSRAQASAQPREPAGATEDRVAAFAVAHGRSGSGGPGAGCRPPARALRTPPGLPVPSSVSTDEWLGLRSHPRPPEASLGGSRVPDWFDDALRRIVGEEDR